MDYFDDDERLLRLERAIENMMMVGTVMEVGKENQSLVKVDFGDELVSDMVPLLQVATKVCRVYVPPQKGEQVLFVSPGGVEGIGFAIRGIYNKERPEPEDKGPNKSIIEFNDKTKIEYDVENNILDIDASHSSGTVNIKAKQVRVDAKEKAIVNSGAVTVESNDINLGGKTIVADGVVTMQCNCVMTGAPHIQGSSKVKALK